MEKLRGEEGGRREGGGRGGEGGQSCSLQPFFYLEVDCEMVAWWPLFPWHLRSSNLCPQHLKRSEMLFLKDKMETKSSRVGKRMSEFSHRSHAQRADTFAACGTRVFGMRRGAHVHGVVPFDWNKAEKQPRRRCLLRWSRPSLEKILFP